MVNRISESVSNSQFNSTVKKSKVERTQESIEIVEPVILGTEQNTVTAVSTEQEELPAEKAKKMTDSLNKLLETTSTKLRYEYHEKLDRYYVTLVDSETDEVVREIPNKKLMDIYAAMMDFVGVFVDEKI